MLDLIILLYVCIKIWRKKRIRVFGNYIVVEENLCLRIFLDWWLSDEFWFSLSKVIDRVKNSGLVWKKKKKKSVFYYFIYFQMLLFWVLLCSILILGNMTLSNVRVLKMKGKIITLSLIWMLFLLDVGSESRLGIESRKNQSCACKSMKKAFNFVFSIHVFFY